MDDDVRRRVRAARDAFLAGESAQVRDVVAASWRRSASAGVDAATYRTAYDDDVDLDSRLVRCAVPVVERLALEMDDAPVAIALSDSRARIVHRVDCSTSVGRPLDRVDFNAGFSFAEDGVGTNGIGTVFESGTSVSVVGAEHFTEALTRFACTGAPVVDPVTGRVEGVLDVSSLAESWTPLMHTLVRRAAAEIGQNLLMDRGRLQQALFASFLRAGARPRQAVLAVGEALMVNRRAQELLGPGDQSAVRAHALELAAAGRQRVVDRLTLADGRSVRLRVSRVLAGDDDAGVVVLVDDDPGPADPVTALPRPSRPAAPAPRRSPWARATARLRQALAAGDPVLVLGEPGAGKAHAVVEEWARLHPGAPVLRADVRAGAPAEAGPDPADRASPATPWLVLARRADTLDAAALARLAAVVRETTAAGGAVAVTARSAPGGPAGTALLAALSDSVTLPPLRQRGDELDDVVRQVLAAVAPGRRVRVSAAAARLLARYPWPGNVAELRSALAHAVARRPVGLLEPDDLPPSCHTAAPRPLTAVETAERDAIVRALADCGGNRLRAAEHLGMSRSSLYRKLASYRIVDA